MYLKPHTCNYYQECIRDRSIEAIQIKGCQQQLKSLTIYKIFLQDVYVHVNPQEEYIPQDMFLTSY